jgi:hypothetical protein
MMAIMRSKRVSTSAANEYRTDALGVIEKEIAAIFDAEVRHAAKDFKSIERLLYRRRRAESS